MKLTYTLKRRIDTFFRNLTDEEMEYLTEKYFNKPTKAIDVIHCSKLLPDELKPVLARIEQINSLGKSAWWEVVYYDGKWCSYSGSKTFDNGEKVVDWEYCKAIV